MLLCFNKRSKEKEEKSKEKLFEFTEIMQIKSKSLLWDFSLNEDQIEDQVEDENQDKKSR